jgi:hypothetical protein
VGRARSSRCAIPTYFAWARVDPEAGTITCPDGTDTAPEPLYEEACRNLTDDRVPTTR